MSRLKINLDAIERDANANAEGFSPDGGVRVGSLLVSSEGVRDSAGHYYELSLNDFDVVPEAEGGFLGRGSSGSVRRAIHRRSGTAVALKEIKVTGKSHMSEIRRELETLHAGDCATPHLVNFYGAFTHEGSVFIAMEAMDGSLQEIAKPVPLPVLACITRQMLKGLFYLHRTRHLMHRDLKPSNVLYNSRTGDIKISDFGVSSFLECTKADAHSFVGTVTYMSPERLHGDSYSYGADIWSLGLVVAELALGVCPFAGLRGESSEGRFWALIQHLNGVGPALELPADMDASLADFINACVVKAPDQRATCSELLHHAFLRAYAPVAEPAATSQLPSPPATGEVAAGTTSGSGAAGGFLSPPPVVLGFTPTANTLNNTHTTTTSSGTSRSPILSFPLTRPFEGFPGADSGGQGGGVAMPPAPADHPPQTSTSTSGVPVVASPASSSPATASPRERPEKETSVTTASATAATTEDDADHRVIQQWMREMAERAARHHRRRRHGGGGSNAHHHHAHLSPPQSSADGSNRLNDGGDPRGHSPHRHSRAPHGIGTDATMGATTAAAASSSLSAAAQPHPQQQSQRAHAGASTADSRREGGSAGDTASSTLTADGERPTSQGGEDSGEKSHDRYSGDSGSACVSRDGTTGQRPTFDSQRANGEPSVNLDDELNKLLF